MWTKIVLGLIFVALVVGNVMLIKNTAKLELELKAAQSINSDLVKEGIKDEKACEVSEQIVADVKLQGDKLTATVKALLNAPKGESNEAVDNRGVPIDTVLLLNKIYCNTGNKTGCAE